jgi:hypothetical protein
MPEFDPDKFRVLTCEIYVIGDSLAERDVFPFGLHNLITVQPSLGICG